MQTTKRRLKRVIRKYIRESIMESSWVSGSPPYPPHRPGVAGPPEGYASYDEYKAAFDANVPTIDPKDVPPRPRSKDNTLYVTRSGYGWFAETDDGSGVSTGDMVLTLLAKDPHEAIFQGSNEAGVDDDDLFTMLDKHNSGVQGGMQNWDNDVFEDYYNVSTETVLHYYAKDQGFKIQETNE